MSDDLNQEPPKEPGAPAVVNRPDYIPETIWDGEKNAPKIDLAATLTEHETLKASAADRASKVPAKAEDYKFELPKDFALPEGLRADFDPKNPEVVGLRALAEKHKFTQDEVSDIVSLAMTGKAATIAEKNKIDKALDDQRLKDLAAMPEQQRAAAKTWLDAITNAAPKDKPEVKDVLSTLLEYPAGIEAIQLLIDKTKIELPGNPGGTAPQSKNGLLAEKIGKPGTSAMDIFNAA